MNKEINERKTHSNCQLLSNKIYKFATLFWDAPVIAWWGKLAVHFLTVLPMQRLHLRGVEERNWEQRSATLWQQHTSHPSPLTWEPCVFFQRSNAGSCTLIFLWVPASYRDHLQCPIPGFWVEGSLEVVILLYPTCCQAHWFWNCWDHKANWKDRGQLSLLVCITCLVLKASIFSYCCNRQTRMPFWILYSSVLLFICVRPKIIV